MFSQYIALGDSLSIDMYPALDAGETDVAVALERVPTAGAVAPIGAASLFFHNDDARWPDATGTDLVSTNPALEHLNLAAEGATIGDVFGEQVDAVDHSDAPTLFTLTIGSEDIFSAYRNEPSMRLLKRIARDVTQAYDALLDRISEVRPDATVLVTTMCDASDRTGRVPGVLGGSRLPLLPIDTVNQHIRARAAEQRHLVLADAYVHFLGHGSSVPEGDRWYWRRSPLEPNAVGANELRKVWVGALRLWHAALALVLVAPPAGAQGWEVVDAPTSTSLRGVSAPSDSVVWVSGASGAVARSVDRGRTWSVVSVSGGDSLDFRDIEAFDASTATVLSIGNGGASRIYRTQDGGATWTRQFTNPDSAAFYDCFAFWSRDRGIAMSDPVDGVFRILRTTDGGATWQPLPAGSSPVALEGEAGFAASGGCVATAAGGRTWISTGGGARSRVLRSADYGASWQAHDIPPVAAGAPPRGAFAVAASGSAILVATGGNYELPTDDTLNVALSSDGGATWRAPSRRRPAGYRSGVAFVPGTDGRILVTVGTSGTDYSADGGDHWIAADTLSLNAVAFASRRTGWAVGPRGRVVRWAGDFGTAPIRIEKEPGR